MILTKCINKIEEKKHICLLAIKIETMCYTSNILFVQCFKSL